MKQSKKENKIGTKIILTCPECGGSTWIRRDDEEAEGAFECAGCGGLYDPEEMGSECTDPGAGYSREKAQPERSDKEEKLEVKTAAGMIRAYKNTDPGRPGILIQVRPEGYGCEIDAAEVCVYEDPKYRKEDDHPMDVILHVSDDVNGELRGAIRRENIFYGPGSVYCGAWKAKGYGYLSLQSCDTGWDYTLYDLDYDEIDGGQIDDVYAGPLTVRDQLFEENGWPLDSVTDADYDELEENAG